MHSQPVNQELHNQIWTVFHKYQSCIDAEIQQRATEYLASSSKGPALMDILAEMPKFPERQSSLIKKAEDAEVDSAEQSAIKLRAQQQPSNALVVADPQPAPSQLGLVMMPSMTSNAGQSDLGLVQSNGTKHEVDSQDATPSPEVLGDLLAIEGPPSASEQSANTSSPIADDVADSINALALEPVEEQTNAVQPIGSIAERFQSLCLKDIGILYEDPYIQVGIKAEWRAHRSWSSC